MGVRTNSRLWKATKTNWATTKSLCRSVSGWIIQDGTSAHLKRNVSLKPTDTATVRSKEVKELETQHTDDPISIELLAHQPEEASIHCSGNQRCPIARRFKGPLKMAINSMPGTSVEKVFV